MPSAVVRVWQIIRDHSGFLAATFGLIATYLASYVALIPPEKRLVPGWLTIFAALCALAFIASLIQQRVTNAQATLAEEQDTKQTSMLEQIAAAVGVTQAEAADAAAETRRQLVEMHQKIMADNRPLVLIRYSVDGDKNPSALPTLENLGRSAATNVKIEEIYVPGNRGKGEFEEIDALTPGEKRQAQFDAPDEGLIFRGYLIRYLESGLQHRPPFNWSNVKTQEDAKDLFAPMKMPIAVSYTDPATGRRYNSEHELEFTFSKHATVIFGKRIEVTA